jgi:hypothetical protein
MSVHMKSKTVVLDCDVSPYDFVDASPIEVVYWPVHLLGRQLCLQLEGTVSSCIHNRELRSQ